MARNQEIQAIRHCPAAVVGCAGLPFGTAAASDTSGAGAILPFASLPSATRDPSGSAIVSTTSVTRAADKSCEILQPSPSDQTKSQKPRAIDNDIQEILEDSDLDEYIDAKTELELRKKLSKTTGLKDKKGLEIADLGKEPFKSYDLVKDLRTTKVTYWSEVMCCHNICKIVDRNRIGKHLPNQEYINMLLENLIAQPTCIEIVTKKSNS